MAALLTLGVASARAEEGGTVKGKVSGADGASTVVVYVEKVANSTPKSSERKPPEMTQRNSAFVPSVVVVRAGESVAFPNEDKIYHNVFSLTPGNDFDLGLYRSGVSKTVQFKEPGEVDVFCNIHPDMVAKVLVLQNDYYAEVKKDGSYEIRGLPPGKHVVVAWTPEHKPERKEIAVQAGKSASADFGLSRREQSKGHLNKNGEQYGRYK
ncbi:MAG: hypothetical protein ACOZIN_16250 [Myxococcota bacterium]